MKKKNILAIVLHTLIVSAALCMFVSCSKNADIEPAEDMTIGFTASDSRANTKLTDNSDGTSVFDTQDKMTVYGYLVHNGTYGTDNAINYNSPYIEGAEINYDSSYSPDGKKYWSFNPARYWPNMGYKAINFYAYYTTPTGNSKLQVKTSTDSYPYFEYETDLSDNAADEDFLVAQNSQWRVDVPLLFKRPLAKIIWKVRNMDWIGTLGVDILMNIKYKGEYRYSNEYDNTVTSKGGWTINNTLGSLTLSYNVQVNGDATATTEATTVGTCYLVPQQISQFAVVYNYHKELVNLSEALNLESGTQYTVTLVISKDKVIRIETSDGKREWYTITNENDITVN